MYRWIVALTAGLIVAAAALGWGHPSGAGRDAHRPEQPGAARAVRVLTSGSAGDPAAVMPADFAQVMGYRPAWIRDGGRELFARPDGGCSSPFGPTSYGFGAACKQHDLGYDLLRYAQRKGEPLGTWARHAIDTRFAQNTAAKCGGPVCHVAAGGYAGFVTLNSLRQGYGTPVVDYLQRQLAGAGLGVIAALLARFSMSGRVRRGIARVVARLRASGLAARFAPAPPRLLRPSRTLPAAAMLAITLQPGMLPRTWLIQALVSAGAALNGYALGWLAERPIGLLARTSRSARIRAGLTPATGWTLTGLAAVLPFAAAVIAIPGQHHLAASIGLAPGTIWAPLLAAAVAVLVTAVVVLAVSGLCATARWAGRLALAKPRAAGALLAVPIGLITLASPAPASAAPAASAAAHPSAWTAVDPGQAADDLGRRGAQFLTALGPASERHSGTAGTITAGISKGTAPEGEASPVRVYVGEQGTARQRAQAAVDGLERSGALHRKAVMIALPTGSGWVNPDAPRTLERRYAGNVATVAVQYSHAPSWLAYLRGGDGAQQTARAVLDAVHARVLAMPRSQRPAVLAYGESLGAWGWLHAYRGGVDDLAQRVDGALLVGVPGGDPASITGSRPSAAGPGQGAVAVLHRDGATLATLVNRDDPVPAWGPGLMVHPVRARPGLWVPLASFWQTTADVVSATLPPDGHGHRYGPQLLPAWGQITPVV